MERRNNNMGYIVNGQNKMWYEGEALRITPGPVLYYFTEGRVRFISRITGGPVTQVWDGGTHGSSSGICSYLFYKRDVQLSRELYEANRTEKLKKEKYSHTSQGEKHW